MLDVMPTFASLLSFALFGFVLNKDDKLLRQYDLVNYSEKRTQMTDSFFQKIFLQIGTEPSDNQYLVVDIGLAVRTLRYLLFKNDSIISKFNNRKPQFLND